jgi:predicted HNH restriction endonuclease
LKNSEAIDEITFENITPEIIEKFKPNEPEQIFLEGKVKYFLHTYKERDKKLVALKKKNAFDKNPLLPCEICNISFKDTYGDIGEGFIEAHHIFPISQLTEETEVKLDDLILICSNCHKMIHTKRPWLTINQIKNLLNEEPEIK